MSKKILILKRKVKYIRIEVDLESLKIITPEKFKVNINEILNRYQKWLQKKIKKLNEVKEISENLKLYYNENLIELVSSYVKEIAEILKVKPEKIIFRKMKVRWGSCHYQRKILIFNKYLRYLPEELIKYVVLHEMCHLIIKNHRKEFWRLIGELDSEFKDKEKLLAGYRLKLIKENKVFL